MIRIFSLAFFIIIVLCSKAQETVFKFDFGNGTAAKGYTKITPTTTYSDATGYGFEFNSKPMAVGNSEKLKPESDFITSQKPFYFSVKLPEGNYIVKVLLGDANGTSKTTIKAENRRLMVVEEITISGKFKFKEFIVHIRDSIIRGERISNVKLKPREHDYLHWDNKLTLEFNNTNPKVAGIVITEAKNIPTIFLAGNSTVVDQANEPWAAWGQMFPAFLNN